MTTSVETAAVRFGSVVPHMSVCDVVRTAEHYRDVLGFEIDGYWDGKEVHQDPNRNATFGIVRRGPVSTSGASLWALFEFVLCCDALSLRERTAAATPETL